MTSEVKPVFRVLLPELTALEVNSLCAQFPELCHDPAKNTWQLLGDEASLRRFMQRRATPVDDWGIVQKRSWQLFFFDMDGTTIAEETIVRLAMRAGKGEEVDRLTEAAMAGHLDFEAALRERVRLLAGLDAGIMTDVLDELTVNPGVKQFIAAVNKGGGKAWLVSGGFLQIAVPLAERLGFCGVHANRLGIKSGKLTGEVVGDVVDRASKGSFARETWQRLGVSKEDTVGIGDGANDLDLFQATGLAVGYRPKAVLRDFLDVQLGRGSYEVLHGLIF